MDNKEIGNRILGLRKENCYTQAQLAHMVNVSPQAVSKWEKGDAMPDVEMLGHLASIFTVTCDYLILGIEENKMSEEIIKDENEFIEEDANTIEEKMEEDASTEKSSKVKTNDIEGEDIAQDDTPKENDITDEEINIETSKDIVEENTKSEKTRIIDEVGSIPNVKVKSSNNDDAYKAAKKMLGEYKTLKWSAMMMPIIVSVLLLAGVITVFVLSWNEMEKAIGHIPTLCTVLVVTIVIALLLTNYVIYKTAVKYRLYLDGPHKDKYPHNAGGYILGGFKKFFVWIGKYTIAIKLLHDANKRLKAKIKTLNETVVDLERLRKL